jgi:hypothetical protein
MLNPLENNSKTTSSTLSVPNKGKGISSGDSLREESVPYILDNPNEDSTNSL